MKSLVPTLIAILLCSAVPAIGQQPKPAAPTPAAQPPAPPAPPPKLPADLQRPRSQLQAEFAVQAGDTVLFAYQAKELTVRSSKILESQAAWLKGQGALAITLEAFCDDDLPADQTRQLCLDRGNAVRAELARLGIPADRFKIATFIDPPPKKGGGANAGGRKEDDKSRRNNRRVVTRIDG